MQLIGCFSYQDPDTHASSTKGQSSVKFQYPQEDTGH